MNGAHGGGTSGWQEWLEEFQARSATLFAEPSGLWAAMAGADATETMRKQVEVASRLNASLVRLADGLPRGDDETDAADWPRAWDRFVTEARESLDSLLRDSARNAASPLVTLALSLGSMFSTDRAGANESVTDPLLGVWSQALERLPRLGMYQHHQARIEALNDSLVRFQKAWTAYVGLLAETVGTALSELGFALEHRLRSAADSPPALREIYDIWLTVNERAYSDMLDTERHTALSAELSNSHNSLQRNAQTLLDQVLARFSLPTRRELTSTQRRLQQVRRQTRYAVNEELSDLRNELRELREEVAKLRRTGGTASAGERET